MASNAGATFDVGTGFVVGNPDTTRQGQLFLRKRPLSIFNISQILGRPHMNSSFTGLRSGTLRRETPAMRSTSPVRPQITSDLARARTLMSVCVVVYLMDSESHVLSGKVMGCFDVGQSTTLGYY